MWIILALAACVSSLTFIMPSIGAYSYAVGGIAVGLIAMLVVAFEAYEVSNVDHANNVAVTARLSLIVGVLAGVFWPAAVLVAVAWLSVGGSGSDGSGRPRASAA